MDPQLIQKLLFGPDMRTNTGLFARGKNVYNGLSMAPNPTGINQATAARRLLEIRQQMYGKDLYNG